MFASQQDSSLDEADALRRAGPSNICADRAAPQCQAYEGKLDDASTQGTISTISYIGGAAFLVGSAVTAFIFWPRSGTKSSAIVVAPLVTASSSGAFASVTF